MLASVFPSCRQDRPSALLDLALCQRSSSSPGSIYSLKQHCLAAVSASVNVHAPQPQASIARLGGGVDAVPLKFAGHHATS